MLKKIYKKIKEYDYIVIARHIGADPDALGSAIGLKEIILNTFPKKNVSCIGVYSAKFKFMGNLDTVDEEKIKDSLLIVLDTPDLKRIDGVEDVSAYKEVIKIDHHPEVDHFSNITWVDEEESSVCQMIIELTYSTKLKMCKSAAEKLFMGLVADTNRFLYKCTSLKTLELTCKLINDNNIDFTSLYCQLYSRPLAEARFEGYISQNMTITENGLAYIKIDDDVLNEFGVDSSTTGSIVGNYYDIEEILVWVFFTKDSSQDIIKVNARSNGPVINTTLEKYNGGGHKFASGARFTNEKDVDKLIKDLDNLCKNYKK